MPALAFFRSKDSILLRPETGLVALLLWLSVSALHSWGSPLARAAGTEWLRWVAGIGLALALGAWLPRAQDGARAAVVGVTLLAAAGALTAGNWTGEARLHGPFGDHQLYGSGLLLFLPMTLAVSLSARDEKWRLGALTCLAAAVTCLALSGARAAWLGTAAGGAVFAVLWLRGRQQGRRAKRESMVLLAAVLVVLLAAAGFMAAGRLQGAVAGRAATLHRIAADGSWQERTSVWRGTTRMIAARPAFGWGLGRYPYSQSAWTGTGRALSPNAAASLSEQAHSLYGQTTAETGLVGLALYAAVFALLWRRGLAQLRHSLRGRTRDAKRPLPPTGRDALCIAALSLLAAQGVDALASPSWQYGVLSVPFWAAVGVGMAAFNRADAPDMAFAGSHRWAWQGLAGLTAVLVAAQWTPLALLTPVQAYATPAGTTFDHAAITCTPNPASYGMTHTLTFKLTGYYKTATNTFISEDMTMDGSATYGNGTFFILEASHDPNTAFGTSDSSRNLLTLGSKETKNGTADVASNITATAYFVYYNSTGTKFTGHAPSITVPVTP